MAVVPLLPHTDWTRRLDSEMDFGGTIFCRRFILGFPRMKVKYQKINK